MRLVDDEQAATRGELRQHLVAELRVVEPLGAHQQHVDVAGRDRLGDLAPLGDVGRVDGGRADAGARGGLDLVAHQREQWRHDHGRPAAGATEQRGGDEVDGGLAESGALHQQYPPPAGHQGLNRGPLVVAQSSIRSGKPPQDLLCLITIGHVSHEPFLPETTDKVSPRRAQSSTVRMMSLSARMS